MPSETPIDVTLRMARDLCLGVGAFFVTADGAVFSDTSDMPPLDRAPTRIDALARSCLVHPAARTTGIFWSAESEEQSDETAGAPSADSSLACAVAPVWSDAWHGLLGVVDVWLPELDDEQRQGLLSLASSLAETLTARSGDTGLTDSSPGAEVLDVREPREGSREYGAGASADETGLTASRTGEASSTVSRRQLSGPKDVPFLGEVLDGLPDGLLVTRADGTILLVNRTFSALTGLEMDSILGEAVEAVLEPGDAKAGEPDSMTRAGTRLERLVGRTGARATVMATHAGRRAVFRVDGRRIESRFAGACFVALLRSPGSGVDLSEDTLQRSLDHIEDGIVCADARGTVVFANRAACVLQGLRLDALTAGTPFPEATELRSLDGAPLSEESHPLHRALREGVAVDEELVLHEGDLELHVAISARPARVDGEDCAIAVLRDVTAEHERREHLTHYAMHDPLTGVANRYLLDDALSRMLDAVERRASAVSLIYLDLDDFKVINDRHGHEVGDAVLRAVARRLERAVRGEDVVARVGGDEFVVAHVSPQGIPDGDLVVARIRKVLSAPYRVGDLILDVRASVGWVSTSAAERTPESLIGRADRAMYERKLTRRAPSGDVPA